MADIRREGDTIFIGDRVAIERGFARLQAKATEDLLSDERTASHYHAPRDEQVLDEAGKPTGETRTVTAMDALGRPITVGKSMTYLDYRGEPGFYVMEFAERPDFDAAKHDSRMVWLERDFATDELQAISIATGIAG